ncbi:pilus assembly protein [Demequina sp. SYSU T00192]|uniref:Pilus assembly protein n=1 Tax=Demequina litoralis TaxID=3051660 RepID=A0ABT8GD80_9MICO|nr:pilus assembly protein [Demequina sp. SYSU T00192]MDN4476629.1 pilus assembly protein [Demequina sp. SYSU T00192]
MGRDRRDDAGAATVELVALTLVLLLPIVYLVVAVSRVQAGAYAAEAAAYSAARGAVVAGLDALDSGADPAEALASARETADAAAAVAVEDFGSASSARVELACEGECLAPGTAVTASVTVEVPLPGLPAVVRAALPAAVTLSASASSPVDGYAP